ncbi:MAG: potassium-transporting ATPase subunit [Microbacterium sp.]|nr:potassium-transporting ATPase subunit [Microbacterium sp.]
MDAATVWFGILQIATLLLVLGLIYRPLGDAIAVVYTSAKDWRVERGLYRVIGVDPRSEQTWQAYLRGVLMFSVAGVLFVYLLQRGQEILPFSLGLPAVPEGLAFNTAVSFVTNTNWQSYSPELTLGYTVQLAGLAVQNFVSAAVGIAVAIALVRGFARRGSSTIGNFWVDLVRGVVRLLLPLAVVAALALIVGGVVQNLGGFTQVTTLVGGPQSLPGGPVASQEAIKQLGTNGGGFFNANSAHPFENPTPWTSLLQIILMLAIPVAMPRAFGRIVGDDRQGYAILAVMGALFVASVTAVTWLESAGNMMLGEIAPGGVGSGLYGLLVLAVIAVFVGGLLVGRTPEYLGKKMSPREITLASLYILVTPTLVLTGTALSFAIPGVRDDIEATSIWNPGIHGLTEVLYAFTSASNNNGSAFAGLTANTPWLNTALGVAMLLGRFVGLLAAVSVVITALTYFPVLTLGPLAEGLA